jgi:2-phospho-L-lactate guanylyltransferase
MSLCAIVPVRSGCEGKTRLAGVLSPTHRAALVRSMLQRVLMALRNAQGVDRIVIVTPDASLVPAGVEFVRDRGDGLNAAVALALDHVRASASAAIVVAADVPEVTGHEIERLVDAVRGSDVVVVPDHLLAGTNALGLRLPAAIAPQFGPGSCAAHGRAARAAGATLSVLTLPGLARDVDVPADLDAYPLPAREQVLALAERADLAGLMDRAAQLTLQGFGRRVSYSRKVFVPLTQLCRDVCHYCTFAGPPRRGARAYLTPDQVLDIARAGARAGCQEALFTLGFLPEARFPLAPAVMAALLFVTRFACLAKLSGSAAASITRASNVLVEESQSSRNSVIWPAERTTVELMPALITSGAFTSTFNSAGRRTSTSRPAVVTTW